MRNIDWSTDVCSSDLGWADAIIVPPSEHFSTWEYEKAGKRKGGRVYIDVRANGEVTIHEGYVSAKEAARLAKADVTGTAAKPTRPEVTATMQTDRKSTRLNPSH